MAENTQCRISPSERATDCHHSRGRAARLLTDDRFFLALSAEAHRWVHRNPAAARAAGMMAEKGGWNSMPVIERTWPYGSTRRATVADPEQHQGAAEYARSVKSSPSHVKIDIQVVVDEGGEGHILVGSACDPKAATGERGTLTFTKGGPTGGYWKFRRDA